MRQSYDLKWIVMLWLSIVLFFPYFPGVFPGYLGSNLAFVFSMTLPLVYFSYARAHVTQHVFRVSLFLFFYFSFSILIASLHDEFSVGSGLAWDSLVEVVRPFVIFVVFLFWSSFFLTDPERDVWFVKSYLILALLVAFLCFFEVYGGEFSNKVMYFLYKRDYKEIIADKATGTFGITYYLSFFLLYPFVYSLAKFVSNLEFRCFLIASLILGAAFISQSRTGFLSYLLATFVVVILFSALSGRRGIVVFLFFLPALSFGAWAFYNNMSPLLKDFTYLNAGLRFVIEGNIDFSGQEAGSANLRIAQIHYALSNMKWLGITGSGMAKDGDYLLESVYAMYLYRYGFVGLLLFFAILAASFFNSIKKALAARALEDNERFVLYASLACFFFVIPLSLFSSAMQDAPKISVFYYGLVSLALLSSSKLNVFHAR